MNDKEEESVKSMTSLDDNKHQDITRFQDDSVNDVMATDEGFIPGLIPMNFKKREP